MQFYQNETSPQPHCNAMHGAERSHFTTCFRTSPCAALRHGYSAFTLTELLVVITIIAILTSLITVAAVNAMRKANEARITLEIQQLSSAMEDFKAEFQAYPPNVYDNDTINADDQTQNNSTLLRFLKKISPRSTEFLTTADPTTSNNNIFTIVSNGLSPAEALVFWLQGFSEDTRRPLSGTDLETVRIDDGSGTGTFIDNVITIDSYQPLFEFDRGRLRFSRDSTGTRRFLTVQRANEDEIFIQLYEYLAPGSQEPYVYFDTSRNTPQQVVDTIEAPTDEFFYSSTTSDGIIYPLKKLLESAPEPSSMLSPNLQYVEYVNQNKFQVLHCGLDDAWGNFAAISAGGAGGQLNINDNNTIPSLLFPEGPFIGDIADTLSNFATGTLEDEQE